MNNRNPSRFHRIASSPITLVIVLVILGVLTRATWNIYKRASLAGVKLSQAQAGLRSLTDEKAAVSGKVDFLSSRQGMEALIREKYRAVREGESVAVIIEDGKTATATEASSTSVESFGWFGRLLRAIGL